MSVHLIDDALFNKIQGWVKDPRMRILKPDETLKLFQVISDQTGDAPVELPLIALSRDSDIEVQQKQKKSMSFAGKILDGTEQGVMTLNAIPITVNYQLDVYTRNRIEGDEYMRNFLFNFVNSPQMYVSIPYQGVDLKHKSNVRLDETISDTSDIPQRHFTGQFTRWTFRLYVDDAYLFSVPIRDVPEITLGDLQVEDSKTREIDIETIE